MITDEPTHSLAFPARLDAATVLALPKPSADQWDASKQLTHLIEQKISEENGFLSFDQYMQLALYAPHLGYYSGQSTKFGAAGDFITAPLISPLFAACIANQCRQWFTVLPRQITEFGAGDGTLAAQLLGQLGAQIDQYTIIELSPQLRLRQQEILMVNCPEFFAKVQWLDQLPDAFNGVLLGNELLDAMPVQLFRLEPSGVMELGVTAQKGDQGLMWATRTAQADLQFAVNALLSVTQDTNVNSDPGSYADNEAGSCADTDANTDANTDAKTATASYQADYPLGYVSEVCPQACAWIASIAQRMQQSALLLIDYGFTSREYYLPQRALGTLMCHYRHHAHSDPFFLPGAQDITAHVNFSALALQAQESGLQIAGYTSQANFLMNCGILQEAQAVMQVHLHDDTKETVDQTLARARASQGIQKLLSEAEMGELFKVLALTRGCEVQALGFNRGDRTYQL